MKSILLLTIAFLTGSSLFAQSNEDSVQFVRPTKLPQHINTDAEEIYPISFNDRLFFARAFGDKNIGGEETGHDIWVSDKSATGDWGNPKNSLGSLNNTGSNAIVGFSQDKNKIYLMNRYNGLETSLPGLSVSTRSGKGWSMPDSIAVPGLDPESRVYGIFVDPLEEVVFVSMERAESKGKEDLYVYMFDSYKPDSIKLSQPHHLKEISSEGFDISPYLSPDRKSLYFSSNREGGRGDADIYKVTRKGDSWTSWGEPQNLGNIVNSKNFDAYFSINYDSTAYFISQRDGKSTDIYETELVSFENTTQSPDEAGNIVYHFNMENYVYFDFDEYILKPAMRNFLDNVIQSLDSRDDLTRIRLEGYADYIGSEAYNKKLGKKRAATVKKYLQNKGVDAKNVEVVSYGETRPALPGKVDGKDMPSFRAYNRRVRIELVK